MISNDGSRVFFESIEALVPRDVNEEWDVYQWEEPGSGTCTTSDPTYGPDSGGCVDLISSGDSPDKSTFLDATPDGSSAFFSTRSRLVSIDTDSLYDVYAARVNGGFAPPDPDVACEGEECRGAGPSEPEDQGAGTGAFQGPGNPTFSDDRPAAGNRRCVALARRFKALVGSAGKLRARAVRMSRVSKRSSNPRRTKATRRVARRYAVASKKRLRAAKQMRRGARRCVAQANANRRADR